MLIADAVAQLRKSLSDSLFDIGCDNQSTNCQPGMHGTSIDCGQADPLNH